MSVVLIKYRSRGGEVSVGVDRHLCRLMSVNILADCRSTYWLQELLVVNSLKLHLTSLK